MKYKERRDTMANTRTSVSIQRQDLIYDKSVSFQTRFTIDTVATPFVFHNICPKMTAQTYYELTFSSWVKMSTEEATGSITIAGTTFNVTGTWTKITKTFTPTSGNFSISFVSNGIYDFACPQLEVGNKATDWNPATSDQVTLDSIVSQLQQTSSTISLAVKSLTDGRFTTLETSLSGVTTRVSTAEGNISTLNQTATSLSTRLTTAEGDITELETTAGSLGGRLTSAEGNITTLTANVTGVTTRVTTAEGNISTLNQTATSLGTRLTTAEGDISELETTATGLTTRVTTAEGNISTLTQTATSLGTRMTSAEGNITTLTQTVSGFDARITTAEGHVTELTASVTGLGTRVTTAEGDISTLEQTATSLGTRLTTAEGDISELEQTSTSFGTRITTAEGNISTLNQTATSLTTRIGTAEEDITTLEATTEGLETTVAGKVGNTEVISRINQSAETITINASKLNLTGYLTVSAGDTRYDASGSATAVKNGLSTSGYTTINGGNIKTGIISNTDGDFSINFTTGKVTMADGDFTGKITSTDGTIGGFTITADKLVSRSKDTPPTSADQTPRYSAYMKKYGSASSDVAFGIQKESWVNNAVAYEYPFYVRYDGQVIASNVQITNATISDVEVTDGTFNGEVNADEGSIGDFEIANDGSSANTGLYYESGDYSVSIDPEYISFIDANTESGIANMSHLTHNEFFVQDENGGRTVLEPCKVRLTPNTTTDYGSYISYGGLISTDPTIFQGQISVSGVGGFGEYDYYGDRWFRRIFKDSTNNQIRQQHNAHYTHQWRLLDMTVSGGGTSYGNLYFVYDGTRPYLRHSPTTTCYLGSSSYQFDQVYCVKVNQSSDRKVKDVIEDHDWKIGEFIDGLRPVTYTMKDTEYASHNRKHMGFIAQEVSDLCHELNLGDMGIYTASYKDDTDYHGEDVDDEQLIWSLGYSEFIAPIVLELQNLRSRVKELEERLGE